MKNAKSVVLLTTATLPPSGIYVLAMTNTAKRIISAKASVFSWAASGVEKIVITDATGHALLNDQEINLLNQMNIEVEQISFIQDHQAVIKKGKGYGEGSIIKHAIENSKILQRENSFFKCTGKIYCRNFIEIFQIIDTHNIKNIMWKQPLEQGGESIDSRFFYTSMEFCKDKILPAYEAISDREGIVAEGTLAKIASQNLTRAHTLRPLLTGFSGSMDRPIFDLGLGFLDNNFPCWLNQ